MRELARPSTLELSPDFAPALAQALAALPAPIVTVDAPITVNLPADEQQIEFERNRNGQIVGATITGT